MAKDHGILPAAICDNVVYWVIEGKVEGEDNPAVYVCSKKRHLPPNVYKTIRQRPWKAFFQPIVYKMVASAALKLFFPGQKRIPKCHSDQCGIG